MTKWVNTSTLAVLSVSWYCAWRVSLPMDSGNVGSPDTITSSLKVTSNLMVSPLRYALLGGSTASTPVTYGVSTGAAA